MCEQNNKDISVRGPDNNVAIFESITHMFYVPNQPGICLLMIAKQTGDLFHLDFVISYFIFVCFLTQSHKEYMATELLCVWFCLPLSKEELQKCCLEFRGLECRLKIFWTLLIWSRNIVFSLSAFRPTDAMLYIFN